MSLARAAPLLAGTIALACHCGSAAADARSQGMLALFHWHGFDLKPERPAACRLALPAAAASESFGQAILARWRGTTRAASSTTSPC